jgi:hypothetical protein
MRDGVASEGPERHLYCYVDTRQLIRQAAPNDFPRSWQMWAKARGTHQDRQILPM